MAIVPMKHLELYGLIRHQSSFLSELQRLGLIEIAPLAPEEIPSAPSEELHQRLTEIEGHLAEINRVLGIFERFDPQRPNFVEQFAGMKTVLTWEEQQNYLADQERMEELKAQVLRYEEEYNRLEQESVQTEREIAQLVPWKELDLPREAWSGSRRIQVLLGSIEGALEAFTTDLDAEEIPYRLKTYGTYDNRLYLVLFILRTPEAEEVLRDLGFVPSVPVIPAGMVGEYLELLEGKQSERAKRLASLRSTLKELAAERPLFQTFYDYWYNMRLQVEANRQLLVGRDVFALAGWVEAEQAGRVEEVLAAMGLPYYLRLRDPEADEEIPIALKNSKPVAPFEALVGGFSYPQKGEVDPTPAVAPFFFLCYGMALGDAGYGLALALICAVLLWKLTMRPQGRKLAWMFVASGFGAVFFGLLTSSIFGFSPYQGLFNVVESPQTLLIVALGLGLVQLYVGTLINAWINIRDGRWGDALWKQGFWLIFLTGILLTVGAPQVGLGQYSHYFRYGTLISAALLIVGNTRGKQGFWAKLIALPGGLFTIYGSVSFFSDVLSYSRLMALGLSGGVMGSIINMFVGMVWGTPVIGWIFGIAIFLFGHALNMGLNVLGAYVHSSRLQYLEFFNTFFAGGGRPFAPLKLENINIFLKKEREV